MATIGEGKTRGFRRVERGTRRRTEKKNRLTKKARKVREARKATEVVGADVDSVDYVICASRWSNSRLCPLFFATSLRTWYHLQEKSAGKFPASMPSCITNRCRRSGLTLHNSIFCVTPPYAHAVLIRGWGTPHRATQATIADTGDDGDD